MVIKIYCKSSVRLTPAPFIELEHEKSILKDEWKEVWCRKASESGMLLCRYYSQQFENHQMAVEPTSHFKKWLEDLPQEGSEAAPADHRWDLGSYLSSGFWKTIMPTESLNKGCHPRRFQDVHFLLARFQHNVDSIFWSKCGFWFQLQRNLKEKRASYVQLYVFVYVCITPPHTGRHFCWGTNSYQDYCGSCKVLVLQSAVVV